MAAGIAAEVGEVFLVRREVWNSRIHDSASIFHEFGKAWTWSGLARRLQDDAQSLLDQILELAAAKCRLRFGAAIEIVGHFDCSLHEAINPYLWLSVKANRLPSAPAAENAEGV